MDLTSGICMVCTSSTKAEWWERLRLVEPPNCLSLPEWDKERGTTCVVMGRSKSVRERGREGGRERKRERGEGLGGEMERKEGGKEEREREKGDEMIIVSAGRIECFTTKRCSGNEHVSP